MWSDVNVTREDGALTIHIGSSAEHAGRLLHWHYDTFRARLGDGRGSWTYVTFKLDAAAGVNALRLDDSDTFEFVRRSQATPDAGHP